MRVLNAQFESQYADRGHTAASFIRGKNRCLAVAAGQLRTEN
jgi:hypothetical protein